MKETGLLKTQVIGFSSPDEVEVLVGCPRFCRPDQWLSCVDGGGGVEHGASAVAGGDVAECLGEGQRIGGDGGSKM